MALTKDQHAPPDGPIPGTPFHWKNNADGTGKIFGYFPNSSIGFVLADNIDIFKTTLEALLACPPGAVTITQSAPDAGGDGGLTTQVNTAKQPAHTTPVKGKK